MVHRVLVINPNSNPAVTGGIDAALASMRRPGILGIECVTLREAPYGIESDDDIAASAPLVVATIRQKQGDFDAFVIACYSDPGLVESRALSVKPVFGIQECAIRRASRDGSFGVLALSQDSIERHLRYILERGVPGHIGERALNITVEQGVEDPSVLDKLVTEGHKLTAAGARALVLGCAGLAAHRLAAEEMLGVPVIDPVLAAVGEARRELEMGNAI